MNRKLFLIALLVALLVLALPAAAQDEELPTLRISALPVINTLPLYVAASEGYYEEEGVNVEIIPLSSAPERDAALQAGETDGANTDLIGVLLLNAGGVENRVTRLDPPTTPFFAVIAGANTGIETVEDLVGVEVASSANTVIEFMTTTLLEGQGLSAEDITTTQIPQIPVRLQLLLEGQLDAATLPEPLTTLAVGAGATVIVDDSQAPFVPTVITFRKDVIDANPEAIAAFTRAYERAVVAIAADPNAYRDVFLDNVNVPEPLREIYQIPVTIPPAIPTEEQVQLVQDWMLERDLLSEPLPYGQIVDANFIEPFLPEAEATAATEEAGG